MIMKKDHSKDRLVDVIAFYLKKTHIKLQPVPPSMSLEALLIPDDLTDSVSDGINGGTGCNYILLLCILPVEGPASKWLTLL